MGKAWLFGLIASSPLVLGAACGLRLRLPKRALAAMLSFAAGALITAVAYELFEDSYEQGGPWRAGLGMFAGAAVFTALSAMLDRWAASTGAKQDGSAKLDKEAASTEQSPTSATVGSTAGLALLAAVTLDGVPENLALGVSLSEGIGGLALLAAIFVSNLPEAFVGSASMREQGHSDAFILSTWSAAAVLLTLAVVLGAGPLSLVSAETISLPLAFAAGAVLASLADTVMPEAYEQGGPLVALSTTAGFVLSFMLATV